MKQSKCKLCARNCNIIRDESIGYCKSNNDIKIAKVMVHMWEEPIISGTNGSGAIFFSNCNLRCVFCQNYKISHNGNGKYITSADLADIMKNLEAQGVHNINLVTPTHYTNQIIEALNIYKPNIPIVWNTNGYENIETIKKLKDYVDIFLFDLKYFNNNLSKKYSSADNYFDVATKNIMEARTLIPQDLIEDGIMKKGIIIRHLVLPNCTNDSIHILQWIKENLGSTLVSVMSQYAPYFKAHNYPEINRKLTKLEYKRVVAMCDNLNLNGFVQDMDSATDDYVPDFDQELDLSSLTKK